MQLKTLLHTLAKQTQVKFAGDELLEELEIANITYDSRLVENGTLFCCIPGFAVDGHTFASQAVASGAAALLVERQLDLPVPQLIVPNARQAMAELAAAFFHNPTQQEISVVGVTGTNGKTTTSFLIRAILEYAGFQTGLLGTVRSIVAGQTRETSRTTPEAIDLQKTFREMVDGKDSFCVMEVSSHALELDRVYATHFQVGIFTNLTQDHLDFHPTMEAYYQAKRKLFLLDTDVAIIVIDDPYGERLHNELQQLGKRCLSISLQREDADFVARNVRRTPAGSSFFIADEQYYVPLPGEFNIANALCAIAATRWLGVDGKHCMEGLRNAAQVPGRFQRVDLGQPFTVVVDYAHTPDSLANVLAAAKPFTNGRLLCLFGCGGDRDQKKRKLMAAAACQFADHVIVTSDNPRSEDPQAIIDQVLTGMTDTVAHDTIVDRRQAIEHAIRLAKTGDTVILAGKGHEQGQEFANKRVIPFDDATVAKQALQKRLSVQT